MIAPKLVSWGLVLVAVLLLSLAAAAKSSRVGVAQLGIEGSAAVTSNQQAECARVYRHLRKFKRQRQMDRADMQTAVILVDTHDGEVASRDQQSVDTPKSNGDTRSAGESAVSSHHPDTLANLARISHTSPTADAARCNEHWRGALATDRNEKCGLGSQIAERAGHQRWTNQ